MNFEERSLLFIKKNKLISPRGLVIVGVSGGADSMALLFCLSRLRHDLGVQLHVAHFNHKFRRESKRDERFVRSWCRDLNVPLTVGRRQGGRIKALSEDDAREMRFGFFLKLSKDLKAQCVALAHTRNDLAETVLMRLMRGSGLYGLRAILPCRSIDGTIFVRPLLWVDKQEVENYLKSRKVPFCTDATNAHLRYERNKVRMELLPLLARDYNPKIIDALSDLGSSAADDYGFMILQARKKYASIADISRSKVKIRTEAIKQQHPAISRLIFRLMAESLVGDPATLSFEHIHALEDLVAQKGPGTLDLPHSLKAVKTKSSLELHHA